MLCLATDPSIIGSMFDKHSLKSSRFVHDCGIRLSAVIFENPASHNMSTRKEGESSRRRHRVQDIPASMLPRMTKEGRS